MFRKTLIAMSIIALVTVTSASQAQANITGTSAQLHSTVIGHSHSVGYIWTVDLYSSCPTHGNAFYARYFVTCDYYGNYLDYGGLDYGIADIQASGRGYYTTVTFWRTTESW